MSSFFIARPWLLVLLVVPILFYLVKFRKVNSSQQMMTREIYNFFNRENTKKIRRNFKLFTLPWILGVLAMSGPTVVDEDKPLFQNEELWVWVMDLSNSMLADDIKPNRYMQMRYSLNQLLNKANPTKKIALVVFAGNAYTLVPPTNDFNTLKTYIRQLDPSVMPMQGTDLMRAVQHASKIPDEMNVQGNILVITDGINQESEALKLAEYINQSNNNFFLYIIGTNEGSALKLGNGSLLKDNNGEIVVSRSDLKNVETLVKNSRIKAYSSRNENDLVNIFKVSAALHDVELKDVYHEYDLGYWMALPLLLLVLVFRQGFIFSVLVPLMLSSALLYTPDACADDMEGIRLYNNAQYLEAAKEFEDEIWKGNAYYKAGEYALAIEAYESASSSSDNLLRTYNLANAYAMNGELDTAILLYQQVLETKNEHNFDARYNLELLKKLQMQEIAKRHAINETVDIVSTDRADDNDCTKDRGCPVINPENLIRNRLINLQRKSDHKTGPAQQW
jgi:Ca-activated chloride channel family protein